MRHVKSTPQGGPPERISVTHVVLELLPKANRTLMRRPASLHAHHVYVQTNKNEGAIRIISRETKDSPTTLHTCKRLYTLTPNPNGLSVQQKKCVLISIGFMVPALLESRMECNEFSHYTFCMRCVVELVNTEYPDNCTWTTRTLLPALVKLCAF